MTIWSRVGIFMGIIGLVALAITGIGAVAAAGGIAAAVSASAFGELAGTALTTTSVSTGLASSLVELSNPTASLILGYVSYAAGLSSGFNAVHSSARFSLRVIKLKAKPNSHILTDLNETHELIRDTILTIQYSLPEGTESDCGETLFNRAGENNGRQDLSIMELYLSEEKMNSLSVNEGVSTILSNHISGGGSLSGQVATTTRRPVKALRSTKFALFTQDNPFYSALADYYNGTGPSKLTEDM